MLAEGMSMKTEGGAAQPATEQRNDQSSQNEVVACRRRALDQQLPAAAFPAGSRAPSLVYLWATIILAAATVLGFALNHQRGVPQAVVESQQDNTSSLASSVQLTIQRSVEDLDRLVAARPPATPDPELVKQVVGNGAIWSGAAVVETASRRPLAAAGSGLPLELLPPALPANAKFPITTPDGPSLVRSTPLDGSRILLAAQPLTLDKLRLNPDARQGVFLLTPDGKSTLMQGVNAVDPVHLPVVFRGLAQSESGNSHSIRVTEWPGQQLVVSSAPVKDTGVTVASLIVADVAGGVSTTRGFLLGLTLAAMAVLNFLLMRVSLVRPVQRLLKQSKAEACGAVTRTRQPLHIAEAHRIGRALALTSDGPSPPSPRRWRPTVIQGLTAATVLALLWPAAALATTLGEPARSTPDQLVRDQESRAEAASSVLANSLDNGLQAVSRISQSVDPADPGRATPLLKQELADNNRFRGLYLVDPSGSVVTSAGREPLRKARPLPGEAGIDLDRSVSRLPVVYAFRLGPNKLAVVGEFDIDYLIGKMRKVDGHARVVDADMRTVLDSEGFRTFQELHGAARKAATEAVRGGTVGRAKTSEGSPALIAAAGLTTPKTVAPLKWSVVVEQDIAGLRLPEIFGQRLTLLVAGAAVGIVLLTTVWQYYVFTRPLRRLADTADKISNGSFEEPIPPQRHDDIGAVAMCLEICRQVRHTGSSRFGGVVRLHTEDTCDPSPNPEEATDNRAAGLSGDEAASASRSSNRKGQM